LKPALLKYLRCVACGLPLEIKVLNQRAVSLSPEEAELLRESGRTESEYKVEILTGALSCHGCGAAYPIAEGVPRLYREAEKDFPINGLYLTTAGLPVNKNERRIQKSFSREWKEFKYSDNTIWLWSTDQRVETFCEEVDIASPHELRGKLMVDAGCGPAVLSMSLSERYGLEIIALDMSYIIEKAFAQCKSNLCHFLQASVLTPPLAEGTGDIVYSHGVLHHTYDTKKAFVAIAKLPKRGGLLYVWLYGKKRGWNRFRFIFIRTARIIISRLPKYSQTLMVYVMAGIHLTVRFIKRLLGMEKVQYKTMSQFLRSIRDKYTHIYAREHTEEEVKRWFDEAGYVNVERRTSWQKNAWWRGSTDLSMKGTRS